MEGMTTNRPLRRALVLVVALLGAALGGLVLGAPASAARTVDIVLTERGPAAVALQPGDSVRFVNGETSPLAPHRVTSTERDGSTPWQFDSGDLGPGQASGIVTFPVGGNYLFVDRRGGPGLLGQERIGRISVTAPAPPPPAPAPQQQAAPPPPAPAPPPPPPPPPAPAPPDASTPGSAGSVDLGQLTAPVGEVPVVPPAVADLLREGGTPLPTEPDLPLVQAIDGPLPGVGTSRPLGLPAALAALAAVGVASLIVRVLLAEPAADRSRGLTPVQVAPAG